MNQFVQITRSLLTLILVFVCCSFTQNAKADTIDFWHIKINDIVVAELTGYSEITINPDTISETDMLSVLFGGCMACGTCTTHLMVLDQNGNQVQHAMGNGSWDQTKISFRKILSHYRSTGERNYDLYYRESTEYESSYRHILRIHLE